MHWAISEVSEFHTKTSEKKNHGSLLIYMQMSCLNFAQEPVNALRYFSNLRISHRKLWKNKKKSWKPPNLHANVMFVFYTETSKCTELFLKFQNFTQKPQKEKSFCMQMSFLNFTQEPVNALGYFSNIRISHRKLWEKKSWKPICMQKSFLNFTKNPVNALGYFWSFRISVCL